MLLYTIYNYSSLSFFITIFQNVTVSLYYNMMATYKLGDMVFAKCQNYPYWPGKIIASFPHNSYKVLFYGQKSQATIDDGNIMPFNDQTYKRFFQQPAVKLNRDLKYSLSVAYKRFNKRKKGDFSSSEDEDFCADFEPKRQEINRKTKLVNIADNNYHRPSDPHIQLGNLLNLLAQEASTISNKESPNPRKFKVEHQTRMKELLQPNSGLLLPILIDNRVIDKFIVVLKELDLWGLKNVSELNQLHKMVRKRYEEYRSIILSSQFASMPLRQSKRQHIVQKVMKNKAVL